MEKGGKCQNLGRRTSFKSQEMEKSIGRSFPLESLGEDAQKFTADDDADQHHQDGCKRLGELEGHQTVGHG